MVVILRVLLYGQFHIYLILSKVDIKQYVIIHIKLFRIVHLNQFGQKGWQVFTRELLPCTLRVIPTNVIKLK
jgi:hypothetical protein